MKDTSFKVYFARCIGPTGDPIGAYKIGCSHGFNDRLKQITASLPFTLELVAVTTGSTMLEAVCHMSLRKYCVGGEYFRECPEVDKFVNRVAETGEAFHYIRDAGSDRHTAALIQPFMDYHGVTAADVGAYLKRPTSAIEKLRTSKYKSRKIVAATALIAASREQYVKWPTDLIAALQGEEHPMLRYRVTGIPPHELRPDIYPAPEGAE